MAYFSEQDLAFVNAHRKPASRFGFAVLLSYLKSIGFAPDKKSSPPAELLRIIGADLNFQQSSGRNIFPAEIQPGASIWGNSIAIWN